MSNPDEFLAKMRAEGWRFEYNPSTWYITASHERGGKQSILEMKTPGGRHELGHAIAKFLNGEK